MFRINTRNVALEETTRMKRFSLPRTLVAALTLLGFFACQETWALAGVTGNIAGTIKDTNGTPIAGAQVQAVSPSQSKSATTDAAGHFVILSLAPDTYTLNLTKAGYQAASFPGVVVFADQSQQVAYTLSKALVTIGRVTAQSGSSLVKSGVGSDLYSVNAAQAAAAASLGGGGNLNNAYSALASVPGVQTSQAASAGISTRPTFAVRTPTTRDTNTTASRLIVPSITTTRRRSRASGFPSCKSTPAAARRRSLRPELPGLSTK
jgi:hypothetical protein